MTRSGAHFELVIRAPLHFLPAGEVGGAASVRFVKLVRERSNALRGFLKIVVDMTRRMLRARRIRPWGAAYSAGRPQPAVPALGVSGQITPTPLRHYAPQLSTREAMPFRYLPRFLPSDMTRSDKSNSSRIATSLEFQAAAAIAAVVSPQDRINGTACLMDKSPLLRSRPVSKAYDLIH